MEVSRLLGGLVCFLAISDATATAFSGFGSDVDTYIKESSQRYQVSQPMLRGLIKMENGWNNNVSPTGATGVGQFTVRTWNWLAASDEGKAIGMTRITPKTRGKLSDPRRNKRVNTLATGLYARWHIDQFAKMGIAITDGNLYIAHNIGLDGFYRALTGKSTADDLKNMRRNGMKPGMTPKDFIVYQKSRYYSHKHIANAKVKNTNAITMNIASPSPQYSPSLRWIEPTQNHMVWVNPVNKL